MDLNRLLELGLPNLASLSLALVTPSTHLNPPYFFVTQTTKSSFFYCMFTWSSSKMTSVVFRSSNIILINTLRWMILAVLTISLALRSLPQSMVIIWHRPSKPLAFPRVFPSSTARSLTHRFEPNAHLISHDGELLHDPTLHHLLVGNLVYHIVIRSALSYAILR